MFHIVGVDCVDSTHFAFFSAVCVHRLVLAKLFVHGSGGIAFTFFFFSVLSLSSLSRCQVVSIFGTSFWFRRWNLFLTLIVFYLSVGDTSIYIVRFTNGRVFEIFEISSDSNGTPGLLRGERDAS